jgi:hypothetical protein
MIKKEKVKNNVSKLDPYKEYIRSYIKKSSDRIPYSVLFADIQQMGYQGGVSILQDFLTIEYQNRQTDTLIPQ